jgi:poly-gamma-glutamate capsule biosynthesis protein CapA/YwtB (metallophosphatase superfamily)
MKMRKIVSLLLTVAIPLLFFGCMEPEPADEESSQEYVELLLVDEAGAPVSDGQFLVGEKKFAADQNGRIKVGPLVHPLVGMVESPDTIAEPVAIGWTDVGQSVRVELLDAKPGRWVYHAGGDVMFGRRYLNPEEGLPLLSAVDQGESAVQLVRHISEVFASADFSTVNLETVVGDHPDAWIYPGKRWILISPENALSALFALGVDMVTLGNNHLRDYLDNGVAATLDAVDARSIARSGGGETESAAYVPTTVETAGLSIALFSFTTVDGDYVNDSYPLDEASTPGSVPVQDQWMWETRSWGYSGGGIDISVEARRIGSAWEMYSLAEGVADDSTNAEMWASLEAVYPEVQDWVARRGHGGAARWFTADATEAISEAAGAEDLVIVQLHSGFQFMPAPSESVAKNARSAIDAGADIVVCHHPHVLQGLEWYKGRLIVYSLGNFIFDQNFFSTFNTMILRTVWDGDELIQARLLPMQLEDYVPVFMVDAGADRVLADVARKSMLSAVCNRGPGSVVFTEIIEPDADTEPAGFVFERHTARIEQGYSNQTARTISFDPGQVEPLPACAAIARNLTAPGAEDLRYGIDLFGWGSFEDVDNDDQTVDMTHWDYEEIEDRAVVYEGCASGRACLFLRRDDKNESRLFMRPKARVPLYEHRLYTSDGENFIPADGDAEYSLRVMAKATAANDAFVRLDFYHFDDLDPTVVPESALIREVEVPLEIPADGQWHELVIDLSASAVAAEDPDDPVNFVLPYLYFPPTEKGEAVVHLDDLALVEWRDPTQMPAGWGPFDFIRYTGSASATFEFPILDGCN